MSEALAKVMRAKKGEQREPPQSEQRALENLRQEAKDAGATLANNGEGGLPSSLVLGVMRRDGFRCKRCSSQENLTVHHKGHLENPASRWLRKKGRSNDENNIVTLCAGPRKDGSPGCHDDIHEEDRKAGPAEKGE